MIENEEPELDLTEEGGAFEYQVRELFDLSDEYGDPENLKKLPDFKKLITAIKEDASIERRDVLEYFLSEMLERDYFSDPDAPLFSPT